MLGHFRRALGWALCLLVLCLMPGAALPSWDWFDLLSLDKLVHAGMFGVLTLLLSSAFLKRGAPLHFLPWAIALSAAYGLGTEVLQGLEALGRRTDLNDMIANTVGAVGGAWFVASRRRKGRHFLPVVLR